MKGRTIGLVGVLAVSVASALLVACAKDEDEAPVALAYDSCAFSPPEAGPTYGFCDAQPAGTAGCPFSADVRKRRRAVMQQQVRAVQLAWATTLQSLRIVERLEAGDLAFDPKLGQRIFDASFGVAKRGAIPQAPAEKRAFIEALRCSPRTWASTLDKHLYELLDADLTDVNLSLPDARAVPQQLREAWAFLGPPR